MYRISKNIIVGEIQEKNILIIITLLLLSDWRRMVALIYLFIIYIYRKFAIPQIDINYVNTSIHLKPPTQCRQYNSVFEQLCVPASLDERLHRRLSSGKMGL